MSSRIFLTNDGTNSDVVLTDLSSVNNWVAKIDDNTMYLNLADSRTHNLDASANDSEDDELDLKDAFTNIGEKLSNITYNEDGETIDISCVNLDVSGVLKVDKVDVINLISENTSGRTTNATNIASNTTNITTNATNIGNNTSNISTNTSNIATNTTELGNITIGASQLIYKKMRLGEIGDQMYIQHSDLNSGTLASTSCAMRVMNNGNLRLNAPTSQNIQFRINDVEQIRIEDGIMDIGSATSNDTLVRIRANSTRIATLAVGGKGAVQGTSKILWGQGVNDNGTITYGGGIYI